jgi:putative endonuclease
MISNSKRTTYYFVYVLRSKKDKQLYVGFTQNLKSRFEEHSKGHVSSTKDRRPLELIYAELSLCKEDATHREKYLKTYHGRMFLRNRLKSYFTG